MNAPVHPMPLSLDQLGLGTKAEVASIDWPSIDDSGGARLRLFGFDEGVAVESLHLGPFGRDPIAVRVGRMTVAIRRAHARAISVIPIGR